MPPEITEWRPNQRAAIQFLRMAKKRVRAVCAPTGFGKTDMYVGDALLSKKPTAFVTESRALQDQLLRRYSGIGMVDLRGRANYDCQLRPDDPSYTCEHGYASRCPFKGSVQCPSSQAEMRAATSWLVSTNYDKWIHSRMFGQGLTHIQRVVFDEGHEAPHALARAMQVTLHHREIEQELGVAFPTMEDAHFFSTWRPWAVNANVRCTGMLLALRRKLGEFREPKSSLVKQFTHLRNLSRRLTILGSAGTQNWIVDEVTKGFQFDPIRPAIYAESALLLRVPEIVVVSATLREKTLWMMGIGKADYDFIEFPSDFDPAMAPVYYIPTMRVDSKATDFRLLWTRLDQIGARRRDRNGIVHTVSYQRRDAVLSQSRLAAEAAGHGKLFFNERGEPATEMVESFKDSYPGAMLVSPSVGQGFDFPFRDAEWQFICKVPFPPPSKILKARTDVDAEYPYYLAMQKLVQAIGRPTRDRKDRSETFIPDDHLVWFLSRYGHLKPKWVNQFIKRVDTLPPPPERLAL